MSQTNRVALQATLILITTLSYWHSYSYTLNVKQLVAGTSWCNGGGLFIELPGNHPDDRTGAIVRLHGELIITSGVVNVSVLVWPVAVLNYYSPRGDQSAGDRLRWERPAFPFIASPHLRGDEQPVAARRAGIISFKGGTPTEHGDQTIISGSSRHYFQINGRRPRSPPLFTLFNRDHAAMVVDRFFVVAFVHQIAVDAWGQSCRITFGLTLALSFAG